MPRRRPSARAREVWTSLTLLAIALLVLWRPRGYVTGCLLLLLLALLQLNFRTRQLPPLPAPIDRDVATDETPDHDDRLGQQLQLLRLAIDANPTAVIVMDSAGKVVIFNSSAEALFDMRTTDLLGRPLPALLSDLLPCLSWGEETNGFTFSWGEGETSQVFRVRTRIWRTLEGAALGSLCSITDVTSSERLKENLSRSERMAVIGQMAAGTVHELRNPLAAARGFVQMLGRIKSPDTHPHEYSELALLEIDRMDQILQEYLLLSKAVAPSLSVIDLTAMLRNTLELLEGVFAQKQLQVATPAWTTVAVTADVQYLQHVLQHLLFNAVEATPETGKIAILLKGSGNLITVTIRDSGRGMDRQTLEHCFDPFYSTKEAGIGLGLTVCQRLVTEMGGLLSIDSTLGVGTTVNLSLPVADLPTAK